MEKVGTTQEVIQFMLDGLAPKLDGMVMGNLVRLLSC